MGRWDKRTRELFWELIEKSKDLTMITYTVEPSSSEDINEFKKILESISKNHNLHSIHLNIFPSKRDVEFVKVVKNFTRINPFRIFKVLK